MTKIKVKLSYLYQSLLQNRVTYWDLKHKTKEGAIILFKDLKESHVKNILKVLKKEFIEDVEIYLEFDLVDFSEQGQLLKLSPNQIIDLEVIKNDYFNNLMY